jgi:hypothetical protein
LLRSDLPALEERLLDAVQRHRLGLPLQDDPHEILALAHEAVASMTAGEFDPPQDEDLDDEDDEPEVGERIVYRDPEPTRSPREWMAICVALSVDVDRFSDEYLVRNLTGALKREGRVVQVPDELRALCAEYRARGFEVFPPCGHTDERGHCLGHCAIHARSPRGVCVVCGDENEEDVP